MARRPSRHQQVKRLRPRRRTQNNSKRREKAMVDALRATVRDLFQETYGICPPGQETWNLNLQFKVSAESGWNLKFEPDIPSQLLPQLATVQATWDVYREGHVYCFECLSSNCSHSAPNTSRQVFHGYGQTGRPMWRDLVQMLIDRQDEQAENLFSENPELCTIIQSTDTLRQKQLSVFGRDSKTYAVLGQLCAGYFVLESWDPQIHDDDRFALTWQVVEARDHQGRVAMHLNTLGSIPGCSSLTEMRANRQFDWVQRAHAQAESQLKRARRPTEVNGPNSAQSGDNKNVSACLRTLASALKQGQRQRRRRTRHAQDRRAVQRPVHKAIDDVVNAPTERFFLDMKHHSVVVLGARSRCHVFADSGKHITSFTIAREAVQMRLRKKRWKELEAGQRREFLERFHDRCESPRPA